MPRITGMFAGAIVLFATVYSVAEVEASDKPAGADAPVENSPPDFDRKIAPLLARRCLDCHSGDEPQGGFDLSQVESAMKGGESGAALLPGNVEASLFWKRIADDEMPPKKPLPAAEKDVLKAWIAGGAKWGTSPINRFRFTTDSRAGYDWWALQPIQRPTPPSNGGDRWSEHPIDRFVFARLNEHSLTPSPEADARTLIRRLWFDLLGLPPSPQDVDEWTRRLTAMQPTLPKTTAEPRGEPEGVSPRTGVVVRELPLSGSPGKLFRADRLNAAAYHELVDTLLRSPHYGERWARHWLDIVRFGESQGFERDKFRPNAWRYRDWVIQALNDDMPYDEFARWQLAGDILQPDSPSAVIATGFLVAGTLDEVGKNQQSAAMKAVVRQDELEDIVSAVGQTFLGLTVHCSRCHDHKFDPVTQAEYYQLAAALGGVQHGERTIKREPTGDHWLTRRLAELRKQLEQLESPVRETILAERAARRGVQPDPPTPLARWTFDTDLKDELGGLHGTAHGDARVENGALQLNGSDQCFVATEPLPKDLKDKTLEAWVAPANLTQRGGGVISVQTNDGATFDAIVFGEREPARWMAGSNGFVRTQSFNGPEEIRSDQPVIHVAIVYNADGTIAGYRNGMPYGETYKSSEPVTLSAGTSHVLFGLRHSPASGSRLFAGMIDRAQFYDRALTADEVAASAGGASNFIPVAELLARFSPDQRERRSHMRFEVDQLQTQVTRLQADQVYAVKPGDPDVVRRLIRGNTTQPAELVSPGGVAALTGRDATFGLAPDAPDDQRRTKLAEWITSRQNPLFARVIVNRLWHYHFGTGLVDSPSDFGFNGGRPTHPELIDWLAAELIDHNFSLKHIHTLIVSSAVYRQSSRFRDEAVRIDAGNRYLWRKDPLRLEAETLRDAILSVSGQLNPAAGGPGFFDFTTFVRNTQFYEMLDPDGDWFHRRSVYRTWIRSGRSGFLDAFDCPDPSTKSPKRVVTTTPIQSLALLNNSFVLRMAERFAERIQRDAGGDTAQQAAAAYRLAYTRSPNDEELALAGRFVELHGLPALCRVLFNSNEFLYVD